MDLGRGDDSIEPCSTRQLHALVVQLWKTDQKTHAKVMFEKKTNLILDSISEEKKQLSRKGVKDGKIK
jgi:hypothetical protein